MNEQQLWNMQKWPAGLALRPPSPAVASPAFSDQPSAAGLDF